MSELDVKIKQSIRLIKALDGLDPELAYSGGKDSDVILTLAQMSGIKFHPIYKMTTIDPPGTITHVKSKGVEIRKPEKPFLELIDDSGFPTRRARFCCSSLKEYKILDKVILGIRKNESNSRKKIYTEPSLCRVYENKDRVEQFFPILTWTNKDVADFVNHYGVECHPLYYERGGGIRPDQKAWLPVLSVTFRQWTCGFQAIPKIRKAMDKARNHLVRHTYKNEITCQIWECLQPVLSQCILQIISRLHIQDNGVIWAA